ncbi:hypothetical protein D3C85_1299170 [compost metagenome]
MGHAGCALDRFLAEAEQGRQGVGAALLQAFADHFQAAADAGQQVVEVVGHTAGQLADGFHFLRLAQVMFFLA